MAGTVLSNTLLSIRCGQGHPTYDSLRFPIYLVFGRGWGDDLAVGLVARHVAVLVGLSPALLEVVVDCLHLVAGSEVGAPVAFASVVVV